VSGRHAQIRREDGKFFLEDLKSRNGTYVHLLDPHELKSGDVSRRGLVFFRVVDQSRL
jgi:pSer/pThr/pTyr-binding forkhead associated (FHA) protein